VWVQTLCAIATANDISKEQRRLPIEVMPRCWGTWGGLRNKRQRSLLRPAKRGVLSRLFAVYRFMAVASENCGLFAQV
jgi:hypothetical protein